MFFFVILYALFKIITLLKINKFILSLNFLSSSFLSLSFLSSSFLSSSFLSSSFLSLSFTSNIQRRLLFYIESIKITSISKNKIVSANVLIYINLFSISLAIISKLLIIDYLNVLILINSFSISLIIIFKL